LSEDKVLDMIWVEMGEFVFRKSTPICQHLLSFLYKEGCGGFGFSSEMAVCIKEISNLNY